MNTQRNNYILLLMFIYRLCLILYNISTILSKKDEITNLFYLMDMMTWEKTLNHIVFNVLLSVMMIEILIVFIL